MCKCTNLTMHHVCEKDYTLNPSTCGSENGKYLESVIENLVIRCDEIREPTKAVPTKLVPANFNVKKVTCKTKKSIFCLPLY